MNPDCMPVWPWHEDLLDRERDVPLSEDRRFSSLSDEEVETLLAERRRMRLEAQRKQQAARLSAAIQAVACAGEEDLGDLEARIQARREQIRQGGA